jgi:hypothetical protein
MRASTFGCHMHFALCQADPKPTSHVHRVVQNCGLLVVQHSWFTDAVLCVPSRTPMTCKGGCSLSTAQAVGAVSAFFDWLL